MNHGDRMTILYALKQIGRPAFTREIGRATGFDGTTLNVELNAFVREGKVVKRFRRGPGGGIVTNLERVTWELAPDFAALIVKDEAPSANP